MNGYKADAPTRKPTIELIRLKAGGEIRLQEDSILALVGPNNAGKSHFLKQLRSALYGGEVLGVHKDEGLIDSVKMRWPTNDPEKYLLEFAELSFGAQGTYFDADLPFEIYGGGGHLRRSEIKDIAEHGDKLGPFIESFVRFDEPISRITETERQSLEKLQNALVRLRSQKEAYKSVRDDFQFIFDEEIHFHIHEGKLNFFLGRPRVPMPAITEANSPEVERFLKGARTLDRQGLGMRNVVGLLIRLYTDSRSVILVDEPEAFLHPPQAHRLGQVLNQVCRRQRRQAICATHDRNFISGLSKGEDEQLTVQRLASRGKGASGYSSTMVSPLAFSDTRGKSRIRFTSILESLFASATILVENENDALFFESAFDFYWSGHPDRGTGVLRDSLTFIPTNGNSNFASTAKLLRDLRSPTVVVGDLDLVSDPTRVERVVSSMDSHDVNHIKDLAIRIKTRFEQLYGSEFATVKKGSREGKIKKKIADNIKLHHADSEVRTLVGQLLELLKRSGVLLIPDGELEDFGRDITDSSDKSEWVRVAIDQHLYEKDTVQDFCNSVVNAVIDAIASEAETAKF